VYPYYHRKYVFISLGGYWPDDYFYMRYYWYGYHPYVWYGYYPVPREVTGDSYTYYTYNYYSQSDDGTYTDTASQPPAVDQSTWANVRQNLDQQKEQTPAAQTVADTRFEEGVKSFEAGSYSAAAEKFEEAMRLSPDDMILPFAYAQAMFADGKYDESVIVLRKALSRVTPDKEGVFYPRGLYANDDVLYAQIQKLVDKVESSSDNDADMQLLLGYHLLGTGETGYAREPLEAASQDPENAQAAQVLLKLADKIESEAKTDEVNGAAEKSSAAPQSQAEVKTDAVASAEPQTTAVSVPPVQPPTASDAVAPAEKAVEPQPQAAPADPNKAEQKTEPNEASPSTPQGGVVVPATQQNDANSPGAGGATLPAGRWTRRGLVVSPRPAVRRSASRSSGF
jgi:tetratricopeptide (TPR) repeat protein